MQRKQLNQDKNTFQIIRSFLTTFDEANLAVASRGLRTSLELKDTPNANVILMQRAQEINQSLRICATIADYTPNFHYSPECTVTAKNILFTASVNAYQGSMLYNQLNGICGDTLTGIFSSVLGASVGALSGAVMHFFCNGNNDSFRINIILGGIVGTLSAGIVGSNSTSYIQDATSSISTETMVMSTITTMAAALLAYGLYKNKASVKEMREERDSIHQVFKKF